MAYESVLKVRQSVRDRNAIRPELMRRVLQAYTQCRDGLLGRDRSWRERRIGKDSDEAGLDQGACRPPSVCISREPSFRCVVRRMFRPGQRDEDIEIEKVSRHSGSDSSSLTCSLVT